MDTRRKRRAPRKRNDELQELQSRAQDIRAERNLARCLCYFEYVKNKADAGRLKTASGNSVRNLQELIDGKLEGRCEATQESQMGRLYGSMAEMAAAFGGSNSVEIVVETPKAGICELSCPEYFEGTLTVRLNRGRNGWVVDPDESFFASVTGPTKESAVNQFERIVTGYALAARSWS